MRKQTRGQASIDRLGTQRGGGSAAAAVEGDESALRPRELLMKVVRGEAVDGHVPSFAQRLAAARQALPYDAPRLLPTPATAEAGRVTTVRVIQFAEEPFDTPCPPPLRQAQDGSRVLLVTFATPG